MKFFTIDWWQTASDDAKSRDAIDAYERHIAAIRHRLPAEFETIKSDVQLHDSNIESLVVDLSSKTASLAILDHSHARRWVIQYHGLINFMASSDPAKGLPGPYGFGDLGYDEWDIFNDGLFEHRLLFSTGIELHFRFLDISVRQGADSQPPT